jgi:hypothetical protein
MPQLFVRAIPRILHKTILFALNGSFVNQIEDEKLNENLLILIQPTWLLDLKSFKIINANIAAQKKIWLFFR